MNQPKWFRGTLAAVLLVAVALFSSGCQHTVSDDSAVAGSLPRELSKYTLPEYVIEPPDLLLIDAISIVPKPPYRVAPSDVLIINVPNAFPTEPIQGLFPVDPDGSVLLGASYGNIQASGLTIPQVKERLEKHLASIIKEPKVFVALGQSRAMQQIRGQHLVTPDGKVRLGIYGSVPVAGLTVPQAKQVIEHHLSKFLQAPEVSVDILAYNSKLFYVIFDGGGSGQQIVRLPVTGNDTVLDAMSQAGGLTSVSSQYHIWVARPGPAGSTCDQILPVDWVAITTRGRTETNYQLLPGDRLFVKANALITLDTFLQRVISPVERMFGVILLGNTTVRGFRNQGGNGGLFGPNIF